MAKMRKALYAVTCKNQRPGNFLMVQVSTMQQYTPVDNIYLSAHHDKNIIK